MIEQELTTEQWAFVYEGDNGDDEVADSLEQLGLIDENRRTTPTYAAMLDRLQALVSGMTEHHIDELRTPWYRGGKYTDPRRGIRLMLSGLGMLNGDEVTPLGRITLQMLKEERPQP